jgi:hypothetical protein
MILERIICLDRLGELLDHHATISFTGCNHPERLHLLEMTAIWVQKAMGVWKKLKMEAEYPVDSDTLPPSDKDHFLQGTFGGIYQFYDTQNKLKAGMVHCEQCKLRRKEQIGQERIDSIEKELLSTWPSKGVDRSGNDRDDDNGVEKDGGEDDQVDGDGRDEKDDDDDGRERGEMSEDEEDSELSIREGLLEMARRVGGKIVEGKKVASQPSRSVQAYKFREERFTGVVKEFDPNFDSYKTGPTAEDLLQMYSQVYASFEATPDAARWTTINSRFTDHGYRRTAGGFHLFYLNQPSEEDQLEHFFSLPPKKVLDEWRQKKVATEVELKDLATWKEKDRLPQSLIRGKDLEVWTLDRMVGTEAGEEDTDKARNTYITGKTDSGSFIRLDLHQSREKVKSVECSVDIDSVHWVTDKLKVSGSVDLHLFPYKGAKAPISTHNHAYVELLWPRTEEDRRKGKRSSASSAVQISSLPNTHFAHLGRAEGRAEIHVVFPRMKHKYPLRRMWETKIPFEVEEFWLEKLVYPGLQSLKDWGISEYTNCVLKDMEYKHKGSKEKSILVAPEHLDKILLTIQKILDRHRDDESYSRFGSLFFVLQILGIKISTSVKEKNWLDLWSRLVSQNRDLDWEHMEDTENGELLLDIGFGFHPPEGSSLVGFWDTDALQQSFYYGGYKRGTPHTYNTASAIGGIHAEMTVVRRKRTQIAYRLAYNLAYEILRGRRMRSKDGFFPTQSAFDVDQKYLEDIKEIIEAFRRNDEREFGVRDEYRCRGGSLKRLLPSLREKVRSTTFWMFPEDGHSQSMLTGGRIHPKVGSHHLAVEPTMVHLGP